MFAAMEREDAVLGGEQSGHIIFRDRATTGDGLLTGIELVRAIRAAGRPLSELADGIPRLPQVMINSVASRRDDWQDDPDFSAAVERRCTGGAATTASPALERWARAISEEELFTLLEFLSRVASWKARRR